MKRILLVEDREDDMLLAHRAIRKIVGDCEITTAHDGIDALEIVFKAQPGHFDLVLLDIQLPKLDGFSVLSRIRKDVHFAGQIVVLLTTSSRAADIAEASRLGANEYMVKPLGIKEFEDQMTLMLTKYFSLPPKQTRR
jgi:CheY-like chemotaxis protein